MKYVLWVLLIASLTLIGVGISHDGTPEAAKWYGSGSFLLFLVTMPLFLFWRRNATNIGRYMMENPYRPKRNVEEEEQANEGEKPISNR
ncbi:MAG: hypothetical protein Q4F57_03405 [Weeksellaceae bacterium]|nr:hypothetical protein [Weeksellaceae bacterium]